MVSSPPCGTIDLSVVIPCYRSGPALEELVDRVIAVAERTVAAFEVILVEDASCPENWQRLCRLAERDARVRAFQLLGNVGQYRATLCGLSQARGEYIATMDDDHQHDPEDLPTLLEAARCPEVDCAMARFPNKQHGWFRNLGSRAWSALHRRIYNVPEGLRLSAFRVMNRITAEALLNCRSTSPMLGPLLLQVSNRIVNVDLPHYPRRSGTSGYGPLKLAGLMLKAVFSSSTAPLRAISVTGVSAAGVSALLGVWYLILYSVGGIRVSGYTSTILLIVFFNGMCLASIGILGEYLARVVQSVSAPPLYMIRSSRERAAPESLPAPGSHTRHREAA